MLYIPKIDNYLKTHDEQVKKFVAKNFSEYFKSVREKQTIRKASDSLYIFLTTPDEVEKCVQSNYSDNCIHRYNVDILNIFDPELQLINNKPIIKSKLKELLSELKNFKVQKILVLDCKKRNDFKIFYSCTKLIASDSDIDKAFKSMHQKIMEKIKICASKGWIFLDVIMKHSIKIFEC